MGKTRNQTTAEHAVTNMGACASCGWDFEHDNGRRVPVGNGKTRTNPRGAICVRGRAYCDVCYCRALMVAGRSSVIGTPFAGLHRDALFPPAAAAAEKVAGALNAAGFDIGKMVAQTAARFGESADDFIPDGGEVAP